GPRAGLPGQDRQRHGRQRWPTELEEEVAAGVESVATRHMEGRQAGIRQGQLPGTDYQVPVAAQSDQHHQMHALVRQEGNRKDDKGEEEGFHRRALRTGSVASSKAAATGLSRSFRSLCWTAPFKIAKRSFRSLKSELKSSRLCRM